MRRTGGPKCERRLDARTPSRTPEVWISARICYRATRAGAERCGRLRDRAGAGYSRTHPSEGGEQHSRVLIANRVRLAPGRARAGDTFAIWPASIARQCGGLSLFESHDYGAGRRYTEVAPRT